MEHDDVKDPPPLPTAAPHRITLPLAACLLLTTLATGAALYNQTHDRLWGETTPLLCGIAAAAAGAAVLLAASNHNARTTAQTMDSIRRNPPVDHTGLWVSQFHLLYAAATQLTGQQREELAMAYAAAWTHKHERILEAVQMLAVTTGRYPPAIAKLMRELEGMQCGAAPAAAALIVRELITVEAFQALTWPWATLQPLPGGDVPPIWHVRIEVQDKGSYVLETAENIPSASGESAAQIAEGLVLQLYTPELNHPRPGRWRLRIWPGTRAIDGTIDEPAAWESYQQEVFAK